MIVAVDDSELARLQELYERGIANGVPGLRMVGPAELREIEPACRVSNLASAALCPYLAGWLPLLRA